MFDTFVLIHDLVATSHEKINKLPMKNKNARNILPSVWSSYFTCHRGRFTNACVDVNFDIELWSCMPSVVKLLPTHIVKVFQTLPFVSQNATKTWAAFANMSLWMSTCVSCFTNSCRSSCRVICKIFSPPLFKFFSPLLCRSCSPMQPV